MSDEGDPFFFEHVLNSVPLVSLDAARELDGVEFFHGTRQQMTQFSILNGEAAQRACLEWAAVFGLEDEGRALRMGSTSRVVTSPQAITSEMISMAWPHKNTSSGVDPI